MGIISTLSLDFIVAVVVPFQFVLHLMVVSGSNRQSCDIFLFRVLRDPMKRFTLECRQENFYVEQKTTNYDVVRLSACVKRVEIKNPMLRALESFHPATYQNRRVFIENC